MGVWVNFRASPGALEKSKFLARFEILAALLLTIEAVCRIEACQLKND
jgi:hypothetical protein